MNYLKHTKHILLYILIIVYVFMCTNTFLEAKTSSEVKFSDIFSESISHKPVAAREVSNKLFNISSEKLNGVSSKAIGLKVISLNFEEKNVCWFRLEGKSARAFLKVGLNDAFVKNSGKDLVFWKNAVWLKGKWLDEHTFGLVSSADGKSVLEKIIIMFEGNKTYVRAFNYKQQSNREFEGSSPNAYIPGKLIAHAGGGVTVGDKVIAYTNTLQALNESYSKGYRLVEVDVEWTSDDRLILLHGWDNNFEKLFNSNKDLKYTRAEFKKLKMVNGLTQMSMLDLEDWSKKHPDMKIITDVKRRNIAALERIKRDCPNVYKNLIPQVYSFQEYEKAYKLGYRRILLALWGFQDKESDILSFSAKNKPYAVSISTTRLSNSPNIANKFLEMGVFPYVHTVNDIDSFNKMRGKGVFGLYTDKLNILDLSTTLFD